MTIRIAIAEDQRMLRELLSALLVREPGFDVVGAAATGGEALAQAVKLEPDVLVLDIGLPDIDGIEVARSLKKARPALRLVALSVHTERPVVQQMLRAGADAYVVKTSALEELVQAIRWVVEGKLYLSPEIAREALAEAGPEGAAALGSRERQVLALLAEGKRSSDIGTRLHISTATVEAHRRNIMRKLGLHTVAELTKYAIRNGLTSL
ncbi:MAG TPA: response regulator transcription factor [Burkholderiales bacterium]|nr:response regulator transcription factor [Burkholderiales bacterium]